MELWVLGTSAGRPILGRNVTSVALQMPQNRGTFWMIDCGEGTQHQLLRTPFRLSRLEKLFITHLHGDHVFGLAGLLSSRSSLGGTEPIALYGPPGLRELIETTLRITETHLGFALRIYEVGEGVVFEDDAFSVEAAKLDHRIISFGYRITERPRTGALNVKLLGEIGVPSGPLYGKLKAGEDITLEDGRIIRSLDVVSSPIPGRVIVVLGDTKPCNSAVELAKGADLLLHEATFSHHLADKAGEYGHSTAVQAAETASAAGVKRLLITHFSTRYKDEDLEALEEEAKTVFLASDIALELKPYKISR
ncbi:ribonuclease Z [Cohnella silvisoli]|uniref:Ribonuclease Z n=1 Tax=Cohnella silvisoli TaxID=2873699 RepID=A0ABV1KNQ5_9BACL|nr:ribonuclease Z [Cohnella silvisoli]MCD9020991.1 ribonuclease Z [Cohnella silvisoli]